MCDIDLNVMGVSVTLSTIFLLYIGTYKFITRPKTSNEKHTTTLNWRKISFFGHRNGERVLILYHALPHVDVFSSARCNNRLTLVDENNLYYY